MCAEANQEFHRTVPLPPSACVLPSIPSSIPPTTFHSLPHGSPVPTAPIPLIPRLCLACPGVPSLVCTPALSAWQGPGLGKALAPHVSTTEMKDRSPSRKRHWLAQFESVAHNWVGQEAMTPLAQIKFSFPRWRILTEKAPIRMGEVSRIRECCFVWKKKKSYRWPLTSYSGFCGNWRRQRQTYSVFRRGVF